MVPMTQVMDGWGAWIGPGENVVVSSPGLTCCLLTMAAAGYSTVAPSGWFQPVVSSLARLTGRFTYDALPRAHARQPYH